MNNQVKNQLVLSGVSSEVLEKLQIYVDMILQWNKAINLVSPSTLPDIWQRHILDSTQLWPIVQSSFETVHGVEGGSLHDAPSRSGRSGSLRMIDLGSGGGLPGIVLGIMGADHVTMVESDKRKCVFLQEVSRETGMKNMTVINDRIENVSGITAPIVTARALASLLQLTCWAKPFLEDRSVMIFPKGQDAQNEIDEMNEHMAEDLIGKIDVFQSITDKSAKIITIRNF